MLSSQAPLPASVPGQRSKPGGLSVGGRISLSSVVLWHWDRNATEKEDPFPPPGPGRLWRFCGLLLWIGRMSHCCVESGSCGGPVWLPSFLSLCLYLVFIICHCLNFLIIKSKLFYKDAHIHYSRVFSPVLGVGHPNLTGIHLYGVGISVTLVHFFMNITPQHSILSTIISLYRAYLCESYWSYFSNMHIQGCAFSRIIRMGFSKRSSWKYQEEQVRAWGSGDSHEQGFFLFLVFKQKDLHCSPGWFIILYVAQAGFKLWIIFLPQSPECWDCKYKSIIFWNMPSCWAW